MRGDISEDLAGEAKWACIRFRQFVDMGDYFTPTMIVKPRQPRSDYRRASTTPGRVPSERRPGELWNLSEEGEEEKSFWSCFSTADT